MRRAVDRFAAKVVLSPDPDGCALWRGSRGRGGYGTFKAQGRSVGAHRWAYEYFVGPIPSGLTIDHLCNAPSCVRPDHLRPASMRENLLRGDSVSSCHAAKAHCPQGHPYAGANLSLERGSRRCRTCKAAKERMRYARQREMRCA